MNPSLCIGIASRDEVLEVAAREGSGKNAIDLALTLGNVPGGEAFVVAAETGKEAADLVRYATRVL